MPNHNAPYQKDEGVKYWEKGTWHNGWYKEVIYKVGDDKPWYRVERDHEKSFMDHKPSHVRRQMDPNNAPPPS